MACDGLCPSAAAAMSKTMLATTVASWRISPLGWAVLPSFRSVEAARPFPEYMQWPQPRPIEVVKWQKIDADRYLHASCSSIIACGGGTKSTASRRGHQFSRHPTVVSRRVRRLKACRDSFQELNGNQQAYETIVGLFSTLLLADRGQVDHVIEAVRKISANCAAPACG